MSFTNKVIIITGASSGIGADAAEHLSKLGGKLVITARNEVNLKKIAEKCQGEVLTVVGDVTDQEVREKIVNETIKKFGKIDVLINNAGGGAGGDVLTGTLNQFDSTIDLNLRSVFHLTQLAAPHLIETGGNIINVSSIYGLRAFPGTLMYSISKAALDQFTKCVALELAPKGVRVNSINPAAINSGIHTRPGGMDAATFQAYKDATVKLLGRFGTVEDTTHAIAFLANNEVSSFITGTLLSVDGGKTIMGPR